MEVKVETSPLKYQQIHRELSTAIRGGAYQVGDKLQSESELASRFAASRSTVIRALDAIEEEGLIERRQGSGSFITQKAAQEPVKRLTFGMLRAVQSGRYTDTIVDQIQSRLSAMLQQRKAALIVHTVENDASPIAVARELMEQGVSGMFMVPVPSPASLRGNAQVAASFVDAGRPVVLLDDDTAEFPYRSRHDLVGIENRHCGFLQTDHLLKRGVRRVLFLGSDLFTPTISERHLGYLDAFEAHGLERPAPEWTCKVAAKDMTEAFVADLFSRFQPEGVVCKSDEYAALLLRHLPRLGVRVPEDLKVVGFDDRPIASLLSVALTTIRQPVADLADAAMQLMDSRMAQPDRPARRVQVSGQLIIRQSTATPDQPA